MLQKLRNLKGIMDAASIGMAQGHIQVGLTVNKEPETQRLNITGVTMVTEMKLEGRINAAFVMNHT
jgi:hypothetical protein